MNMTFTTVEQKILEELAKKGALTGKREQDKKKYLKQLLVALYSRYV